MLVWLALLSILVVARADEKSEECKLSCEGEPKGCKINPEAYFARKELPHKISLTFAPTLPRIVPDQLALSENLFFKNRRRPFIMQKAMQDWPALEKWKIDPTNPSFRSEDLFAQEVADFYQDTLISQGSKPTYIRFNKGIQEIVNPTISYEDKACEAVKGCRQIILPLAPSRWDKLEQLQDIPKSRHNHLNNDNWWMRRCLPTELQEEFHLKTHWKTLTIGSIGSGTYNQSKTLGSSWNAQVTGRRWWYICSPEETSPHQCFEAIVNPGEVLFYPNNWYTMYRNLDLSTIVISGNIVTLFNYRRLALELHGECSLDELGLGFSWKLCDSFDKCFKLWEKQLTAKTTKWVPWRDVCNPKDSSSQNRNSPVRHPIRWKKPNP